MTEDMLSPCEALDGQFQLPDIDPEQQAALLEATRKLRAHAFMLGGYGFLVDTEVTIAEIFESLSICRLPNTTSCLYGMANRRGNIVPVFDPATCLGLDAAKPGDNSPILVINLQRGAAGLILEELPARIILSKDEKMSELPDLPEQLHDIVTGAYKNDSGIWLEWDIDAFFKLQAEKITV